MNVSSTLHPAWLAAAGIALLIGLWLLRRGRRGRRVGDELYCAKCNYSLQGLEPARCPECGGDVSVARGLVIGRRVRLHMSFALGAALTVAAPLFVAPAAAVRWARAYDWYRFKPTGYVLDDLMLPSLPVSVRAWREIERREQEDGPLPKRHHDHLAELALAEQRMRSPSGLYRALVPWLIREMTAGRLTEDQKNRLFEQMPSVKLDVRPTVIQGDDAPFQCTVYAPEIAGVLGQQLGWRTRYADATVSMDGGKPQPIEKNLPPGFYGIGTFRSGVPVKGLGLHELTFVCHIEYWSVSGTLDPDSRHYARETLQRVGEVRGTGQVRVVPDLPENHVPRVRPEPGGEARVRGAIKLRSVAVSPGPPAELRAQLGINAPPVGVAFAVFARAAGTWYPLGTIAQNTGTFLNVFDLHCDYNGPDVLEKVDLVFSPEESAARQSPFITEMWDGVLEFKDVPLSRPPQRLRGTR